MDPKQIRELIELIQNSPFDTFELEREGFKLKLSKGTGGAGGPGGPGGVAGFATGAPAAAPLPAVPHAVAGAGPAPGAAEAPAAADDGVVEMKSPIVGTFYTSANPDAPPFVEVGSRVKAGDVVCIIEAMKVMNEIEADVDAEVVEIVVKNGQPVEFGEVLFKLRPSA